LKSAITFAGRPSCGAGGVLKFLGVFPKRLAVVATSSSIVDLAFKR
jgi:hypothetical protein